MENRNVFSQEGSKISDRFRKIFSEIVWYGHGWEDRNFTDVIATTLRTAFGGTARSIKTVMAYTGAGERTVKNWFEGKNAPNGENLVELMRHSDEVLESILMMAGRQDILAGKLLVDARDKLAEMIEIIDQLRNSNPTAQQPKD